jgi:heme exporter protein C
MINATDRNDGVQTKVDARSAAPTPAQIALLLVQCAIIAGGFLWLPDAVGFRNPGLARIVVFHVPCAIVATFGSVIATWYAICYLRSRSLVDDIKSRTAFALALMFWILTTITGAVFAKTQWGDYWNWDIKQSCILMLLLICIAYFALRAAIDNPDKQATLAAVYAIFTILAVEFLTNIIPNSTDNTLHPKNVLDRSGALDWRYSLELWSGVVCLSIVYVWAFRIQVALEQAMARMARLRGAVKAPSVRITEVKR